MKKRNLLALAVIGTLTFFGTHALAGEDEWSDYDPCGWNVEGETVAPELALVVEDEWSDYDPCGWNVDEGPVEAEIAGAYTTKEKDVTM